MPEKYYIYGLIDPTTMGIRYIGKTNNPRRRIVEHSEDVGRAEKSSWIRSLRAMKITPIMVILEEVDKRNVSVKENEWIKRGISLGWALTNTMLATHKPRNEIVGIGIGTDIEDDSPMRNYSADELLEMIKGNLYRPVFVDGTICRLARSRNPNYATVQVLSEWKGEVAYNYREWGVAIPVSELPDHAVASLDIYRDMSGVSIDYSDHVREIAAL